MCELCTLAEGNIRTKFYYRNSIIIIVDCATCGIPMVTFRHHGLASEDERRKALGIVNSLFDYTGIRGEARKIFDHEHWHIEGAELKC